VRYCLPKPGCEGRIEPILSPSQLIERVAALMPALRRRKPVATALALKQDAEASTLSSPSLDAALPTAADETDRENKDDSRKPHYLCAVLLTPTYGAFPLTGNIGRARCGTSRSSRMRPRFR